LSSQARYVINQLDSSVNVKWATVMHGVYQYFSYIMAVLFLV